MAAFSFKKKNLTTKSMRDMINIIEALIFLLPLLIVFYMVRRNNYHFDTLQLVMLMGIAFFILAGMIILRQILDRISIIAAALKKNDPGAVPVNTKEDVTELREISVSLSDLVGRLESVTQELARKTLELATIRDLTDILKGGLNIDDQMALFLEKCMAVTGAEIGSVFLVEPETRQKYLAERSTTLSTAERYYFRICAEIGHGDELKREVLVDPEKSVVRAVLLEKAPLLVEDISSDPKTLKANDPRYGSPSFLSMPVMRGEDVSAIVNLAGKKGKQPFDKNDEEALSIILRDMGISMENTMLRSKIKEQLGKIRNHDLELEREIQKVGYLSDLLKHYEKKA